VVLGRTVEGERGWVPLVKRNWGQKKNGMQQARGNLHLPDFWGWLGVVGEKGLLNTRTQPKATKTKKGPKAPPTSEAHPTSKGALGFEKEMGKKLRQRQAPSFENGKKGGGQIRGDALGGKERPRGSSQKKMKGIVQGAKTKTNSNNMKRVEKKKVG